MIQNPIRITYDFQQDQWNFKLHINAFDSIKKGEKIENPQDLRKISINTDLIPDFDDIFIFTKRLIGASSKDQKTQKVRRSRNKMISKLSMCLGTDFENIRFFQKCLIFM